MVSVLAPREGHGRALGLAAAGGVAAAVAASQALYGLGWNNALVSDDWFFAYGASRIVSPAQLLPFFSFETGSFVRPTQWLLTIGLYRLFGSEPLGYHVVSQLLDLANAGLVGQLAGRLLALTGAAASSRALAGGLVAVLFLFSWRHHEAVFWFSAVNEPLACAFRLIVLNRLAGWLAAGGDFARTWLVLLLASGLAMLSKESAAVLPVEALLVVAVARLGAPRPDVPWRAALALVGAPALIVLAWAWVFIRTSAMLSGALTRGVSQTLTATAPEWALRFLQFFNANYAGTEQLSASPALLAAELGGLLALALLALARRQYLWLFALAWTLVTVAPYAVISHGPDVGLVPVLELGVRGDRFLYASAAGASLLLVASGLWLREEARRWTPAPWPVVCGAGALLAIAGVVGLHAVRLWQAERDWDTAGRIARQVRTQVRQDWPNPAPGETLCLARLPHAWHDKPVYRNGIAESLFLAYGHDRFAVERFEALRDPAARGRCTLTLVYAGLEPGLVRVRMAPARMPASGAGLPAADRPGLAPATERAR